MGQIKVPASAPVAQKIPKEILKATHIVGSHQVHVRPPTRVKLNPNATHFCVSPDQKQFMQTIPLLIKGIPPFTLELEHYALDGTRQVFSDVTITQEHLVHPSKDPLVNEEKKHSTQLYALHVHELGLYRIASLTESNGDSGKVISSFAEIIPCPTATWNIKDQRKHLDSCVHQETSLSLSITGVPPLRVYFSKRIQDVSEATVSIDDMRIHGGPVDTTDPSTLVPGSLEDMTARLHVLQSNTFQKEIIVKTLYPKDHVFQLLRVMDGRNNTVDYRLPPGVSLPARPEDATHQSLEKQGDVFVVHGRALPHVSFSNCDGIKIKMDQTGMSALHPAHLPLVLSGNGNWRVGYGKSLDQDNSKELSDLVVTDPISFNTPRVNVPVYSPGTYMLQSVEDQYCKGSVMQPFACSVIGTFPPTLSIASSPIESSCIGAIGTSANLSFTGEPPFWVEVEEELLEIGERSIERYSGLKSRHMMRFEPTENGTYRYTFVRIGDGLYPEGVSIAVSPISQIVHQHPSAHFTQRERLIRCINDTADFHIHLEGSGPWSLTYEIMHDSTKVLYTVSDVSTPDIRITTPPLSKSGLHTLSLNDITDANGCTKTLDSQDVSVEVLAQRPSVSFSASDPVYFLEGHAVKLPITVTGRGTVEVTYIDKATPDEKKIVSGSNQMDHIYVSNPSTYELRTVQDSYCTWIPKPYFTLETEGSVHLIKRPVCEGVKDSLRVGLSGKPPFHVYFIHNHTSANSEVKLLQKEEVISEFEDLNGSSFAEIDLETKGPGLHQYHFLALSDGNYRSAVQIKDGWTVEQRVFSKPVAEFVDADDKVFHCLSDEPGETTLPIRVTGEAPFTLVLTQKHDNSEPVTITRTIQDNQLERKGLLKIYNFDPGYLRAIGSYTFELVSISDASSCLSELQRESSATDRSTKLSIHVADQAKVSSNNAPIVCVGDMLTYSLQGTPPFTIGYTWNGNSMPELIVDDPILTLFASEAGSVVITKVCNAMKCCNQNLNGLTTQVKGLPSAIVDGGEDLVEDIREGDESTMSIEFKGEPPFSVTWTRSEVAKGKTEMPSDSFSESNIMSNKHSITTSQEGIFTVTSVHDKYCGFPRNIQDPSYANSVLKS